MNDYLRNILLGITLAAPLGPASVAVMQNGFQRGFKRAFLTGIGITMADTTYLMVVFFGLASFLNTPTVKMLLWTFGTIVLIYLGIQSLREGVDKFNRQPAAVTTARNPLLAGYIINISNPLAVIWWLGIFGSVLGSLEAGSSRLSALASSSAILAGILFWHSLMSIMTHWGKRFLTQRTIRAISILAGMALILFGLRFAYSIIETML